MSDPRVVFCAMLLGLSACAAPLASTQPAAAPQPVAAEGAPGLRLPEGVRPLGYTLELSILPKQERFSGRTQIAVSLSAPSARIWLHGKDLRVSEVRARAQGDDAVIAGSYQQQNEEGLALLTFERPLPAGLSLIVLRYDAPFDRQLQGLYRVDVASDNYAFTQFETLSARLAFPCFDEPDFKTPFDVWLTVSADDVALANTQPVAEQRAGDYKRIHFAQTKPLPTYLVAFAVGPLDVVETAALPPNELRSTPVPLRGVATKGRGPLLAHALSTLAPTLGALENYFGIAYPYDKLDIVAVPDFSAGAMENAGLVTFRDQLLLLDPQQAGEAQRRSSQFVLAHELSHQWFGDLVTMHFWDDIWLNEAFATWLEYRVVSGLHPEYKGELELVEDMQDAMESDSRVTARMIRQPILSTHDILNAFDGITYSKGGGVIGMFERYLGAGVFQQGIRTYLKAHAFGNASTADLLAALSQAAERDVGPAFDSFLTQPGVPLVSTQVVCAQGETPRLELRQARYFPLGSSGKATQSWQIPICARYESAGVLRENCTLLREATGALPLDGGHCPSWVMPNADGAGYYRFSLASDDLARLRDNGLPKLPARERYVLARALIAGFEANTASASDLLTAFKVFAGDAERMVATVPIGYLRYLRTHWIGRPSLSADQRAALLTPFEAYIRTLYGPIAQRLGATEQKSDSGDTKLLRAQVLGVLCDLGNDVTTRAYLARMGRHYLGLDSDGKLHAEVLPAELIDLGVRMSVEQGDQAAFDGVYEHFRQSDDATERARYLSALSAVVDARSKKALELALDPTLRVNEVMIPLRVQLSDYRTRAAAYAWFEQHFDALQQRLSPSGMGYSPWLASGLCDSAESERINAFFKPRVDKLPGAPRSLGGALETLGLCDALFKAQSPELDKYFLVH